ncbi:hypothetical protein [Cupriavidus pauculus]|uniref:DUF1484 family protein n=1 Tax=Cupriavidus pauculus TaxID=82633 RepID=A0A2N5CB65_9BURK|nr:hypothetical protein [Cupriavidus pauculus]PLP99436.1 hypothetical protein CYJ10_16540 [Cupriavidus pauculus]
MNQAQLDAHYEIGLQHAASCRAHIRIQIALIRQLQTKAYDSSTAAAQLSVLLGNLSAHREHLALIRRLRSVQLRFPDEDCL